MRIHASAAVLAVVVATCAVASASAAELRIEGVKQAVGFTEKTSSASTSAAVLKVSGGPTIICVEVFSKAELSLTEPSPGVFAVSKLNPVFLYDVCTVTTSKITEEACEVVPVEVLAANKGITVTGETGKAVYEARSGKPLAEVTIKSKAGKTCPFIYTKQPITGTQECSVPSITTELVEHELSCPSSGSKLLFAEKALTIEGSGKFGYTGTNKGKKFSVH